MNRKIKKPMITVAFFVVMAIFTGMAAASTVTVEPTVVGSADTVSNTYSGGAYVISDSLPYNGAITNTYKANINPPVESFVDQDWYQVTAASVGKKYGLCLSADPRNAYVEMFGYDGSLTYMGRNSKKLGNQGPYTLGSTPLYVKLTRGNGNTNAYYGYTFAISRDS